MGAAKRFMREDLGMWFVYTPEATGMSAHAMGANGSTKMIGDPGGEEYVPTDQEKQLFVDELMNPGNIAKVFRAKWGYADKNKWIVEMSPKKLTCYDLVSAIRVWLKQNGHTDKSVVEVLQERGWKGVGGAQIFVSHTQLETVIDLCQSLGAFAMQQPKKQGWKAASLMWIDAFCLRQCASGEFNPAEVVALIGQIGKTAINMDKKHTYPARSFCLLELYATVKSGQDKSGGHEMMVREPNYYKDVPLCCLKMTEASVPKETVDAAAAQSRDPKDKELIDEFIRTNVDGGFATVNQIMEREVAEARRQKNAALTYMVFCCPAAVLCKLCVGFSMKGYFPGKYLWDDCVAA